MTLDSTKNAVQLVDQAIKDISGQQLVSTSEMTDLLLDIRLYLLINEEPTPSNSTTIN
jgi:hypothetical protein